MKALLVFMMTHALFSLPAAAQDPQPQSKQASRLFEFNIPAQPLDAALKDFAGATDLLFSFESDLTSGLTSSGVVGRYTARQALGLLLASTGLNYRFATDKTVTLEKAPAPPDRPPSRAMGPALPAEPSGEPERPVKPVKVPEIVVKDVTEKDAATYASAGTKTDTPLIETPRSISVITADQINYQKVQEIGSALRYTAGIFAEPRGTDTTRQSAIIRGFYFRDDHMVYRDGMRGQTSALLHPDPDVYGLERVEVLRGPASMLYGQNVVGGLINTITKRPTQEFFAELETNAGTFNQFAGKFDVGGSIDGGKRLLFRLTGLTRDGNSQIDFMDQSRKFVAPALTWRPTVNTTLTFLSHYQKDETFQGTSVPASGTIFPNPNGQISTSFLPGEPGFDRFDKEVYALGYLFEHRWNNSLKLRQNLRYTHSDLDYRGFTATGFQANNRTLNRVVFTNLQSANSLTTDTGVQAHFNLARMEHMALLGVDYRSASVTQNSTCCTAGPTLDAFNPIYGQAFAIGPTTIANRQDFHQVGIYLQDQVKLYDKWVLTLGARHDWAPTTTYNQLTRTTADQHDSAFTGQAGLVHLFDNGLAPYVNYSTSFLPVSGFDAKGQPFVPSTGTQYEGGIKFQPQGFNGLITVSAFQLTQQKVLTPDPVNVSFNVQTGEVRSRGIELEAKANLFHNLNVIATYSYTDVEVTKSNSSNLEKRPINIPTHLASFWADYSITDGPLAGLGFGGGVRHIGNTSGDINNTFKVPDFTLVDAALHYDFKGPLQGTRLAINVSNLFDEPYVASCLSGNNCFYGARRVVTASLRYRW